ncbi:MAG: hypothetical protein ACI9P5_000074 [Saprospiraceae bacterium]|jgi:hypothetical protein
MMKDCLVILFSSISLMISAQSVRSVSISIIPVYKGELFDLNNEIETYNTTITKLKFYVSKIGFSNSLDGDWIGKGSCHLLDMEKPKSMKIVLQIPDTLQVNSLCFNLGVDSLINVSGAMSGDLDPMQGMYWAWQSGYINFKLEGKSDKCPARKNKFQFHLGGFLAPYNTLQKVTLPIVIKDEIFVVLDIGELIEAVDVSKTHEIMSPRSEAVSMAQKVASLFKIVE